MTKSPSRPRLLAALAIVVALPAIIGGTWAGLTGTTQTIDNRWASITILPPQNTTPPQITAGPGADTAQADTGAWDGDPTGFTFQWQRCNATGSSCQNIPGATTATYTPAGLDDIVAARLRVQVTASNAAGPATVASAPTVRPSITPTTPPALTGTPTAGQTLTLTSGTWAIDDTPGAVTYLRWERCDSNGENCVPRPPSTEGVYTTDPALALTSEDTGHRIRVIALRVAPTGQGIRYAEQVANELSAAIGLAPVNTGPPEVRDSQDAQITGSPFVTDTLRASTGTWANQPTNYTYQWQRCDIAASSCAQIDGATSENYQLVSSDYGHRIRVEITASNAYGQTSEISPPTAIVAVRDPINTDPPTISGSTVVGGTLSATTGTWLGANLTYAYQWQRCDSAGANCTTIAGATGSSYTTASPDIGNRVRVRVIATQNARSSQATSAATSTITTPPPVNTTPPDITGATQTGATLTATRGVWQNSPTDYAYQWQRCDTNGANCQDIGSATSLTYTIAAADVGKRLRFNVTATNYGGSATASALTGTVIAAWQLTGALTSARSEMASALLPDGRVLAIGGSNGSTVLSSTELYNPQTNTWTTSGTMVTGRFDPTGDFQTPVLLDGRVLVAGGYTQGSSVATTSSEIYNPTTGNWNAGPPMSQRRASYAWMILPDGRVLVAGGSGDPGGTSSTGSAEIYDPQSNSWSAAAPMNAPRYNAAFARLRDGRLLVAGGANGSSFLASAEIYDPETNTWTSTGSLPQQRGFIGGSTTVLPNGKVLVHSAATSSGAPTNEVYVYDPAAGTWSTAPSLGTARWQTGQAIAPDGRVIVVGGIGASVTATTEQRDPTSGVWTAANPLNVARRIAGVQRLADGQILAFGGIAASARTATSESLSLGVGQAPSNGAVPTIAGTAAYGQVLRVSGGSWTDAQRYAYQWQRCETGPTNCQDIAAATWGRYTVTEADFGKALRVKVTGSNPFGSTTVTTATTTAISSAWYLTGALSTPRSQAQAARLDSGKIVLAGGTDGTTALRSVETYDPATKTWTTTNGALTADHVGTTLNGAAPVTPDGRVVIAGGANQAQTAGTAVTDVYNPSTGTWSAAAPMAQARTYSAQTVMADGRVLVAGGNTGGGSTSLASVEAYNTKTNTWTTLAPMAAGRSGAAAVTLADGKILVAGGTTTQGVALSSAELYNPQTNTWTPTGAMTAAIYIPQMTLLSDGRVLIGGGRATNNAGSGTATAMIYDPATNTWTAAASMTTGRAVGSLHTLPDGRVLAVAGHSGSGGSPVPLTSVEIYNPTSNSWSAYDGLNNARWHQAGVDLADGSIMTIGGLNASGARMASVELHTVNVTSAPADTVAPSLSTTSPTVGSPITVSAGAWSGAPRLSYQWRRCDITGANCVDIQDAAWPRYTPIAADSGSRLRAIVTATNAAGAATVASSTTTAVASTPPSFLLNSGADSSADLTEHGVLSSEPGRLAASTALTLNASTDTFATAPSYGFTGASFTVEADVRFAGNGQNSTILAQGTAAIDSTVFFGTSGSNMYCSFYGDDAAVALAADDLGGNWHRWSCTFNASTKQQTLYRDGVVKAQRTATAAPTTAGLLHIGIDPWSAKSAARPFNGRIDDVAIYNSVLPTSRVAAHVGSPTEISADAPRRWYRFGDG